MTDVYVKICRVNKSAKLPAYANPGDSGMDLQAMEAVTLTPGRPMFIKTGIALRLPAGYEAQIRPRSSLSKAGVHCAWGTCDAGYVGELAAVLTLTEDALHDGVIKAGDRIAQMVIVPVPHVRLVEVEAQEELGSTERGAGGFGSSGR